MDALTDYTANCARVRPEVARNIAVAAAHGELITGARDSIIALRTLRRAIQRLSQMPGDRVIIVASPGFLAQTSEAIKDRTEALQLAAQSQVVINGLSVRGLILAEEEEDVAEIPGSARRSPPRANSLDQSWLRYRRESARADGDVLEDLAEGTGGAFFHNNNDLAAGLDRLVEAPAFSYVLGFAPTEAKGDGQFHQLKIRLAALKHASVEARRGYYDVKLGEKTEEIGDVSEAIFSHEQKLGLPIVFQKGYSKPFASEHARILVTAKIDLTSLRSTKPPALAPDGLTAIAVLFDSNGAFLTGTTQRMNELAMQKVLMQPEAALTLHWDFEVTAGVYATRLVIASADGRVLSALSRTVNVL